MKFNIIRNWACLLLLAAPSQIFSQTIMSDTLDMRFAKFANDNLREKLFLHTDKSFYLTGEIIWFKVYSVDGSLNQPLDLSKVAYVELIGGNHEQVLKAKIALKDGSGNGSLLLPQALSSGNYTIRAYTQWMKNFSADFYFHKTLTIVKALKIPASSEKHDSSRFDIQFFPEGGNLVYGIRSKVAFRVADRNGKGRACSGSVISGNGSEVVKFNTLEFGLGQFYFTPVAGEHYRANINLSEDTVVHAAMPEIRQRGYVMELSDSGKQLLKVTVTTDLATTDPIVYLLVHTRQLMKFQAQQILNHHVAVFLVERETLGEGISHFTVFNAMMQPVGERLYFKRPRSLKIDFGISKEEFATREKVNVNIATHNEKAWPMVADMSVSVFREDSLQALDGSGILSYFWLSSDLKGMIESPDYYFGEPGDRLDEATDNLMLTHGWTRFKWEEVFRNENQPRKWLPEYEGHVVNGRIWDKNTGLPAESIVAYLSAPDINYRMNTATSDAEGRLYFNMMDFFGNAEVIVQTNSVKDSSYRIEIENPFSENFALQEEEPFYFAPQLQEELLHHSIGLQVQNAYFPERSSRFYSPGTDSLAFYGRPDKKYRLDDYTRFTSLEEILREYVAEVGVRHVEGKSHIYVWRDDKVYVGGDPLVLLDGVPYFDMDSIFRMDPLKIRKLEVVKRKFYLGGLAADGIISFTSYNGDLGGTALEPNAVILDYEGLQLEREFFSPVYEMVKQKTARLPDFRNTLYWSPDVRTDTLGKKQITFYTGDEPGNYLGVIQGICRDGTAGSQIFRFVVK